MRKGIGNEVSRVHRKNDEIVEGDEVLVDV